MWVKKSINPNVYLLPAVQRKKRKKNTKVEQQKPVTYNKSAFTFWKSKRQRELFLFVSFHLRWSSHHPCQPVSQSAMQIHFYLKAVSPASSLSSDNFRCWPKTNSVNYFIMRWGFSVQAQTPTLPSTRQPASPSPWGPFSAVACRLSESEAWCRLSSGERQIKRQFVSPVVSFSYYSYAYYTFRMNEFRILNLFRPEARGPKHNLFVSIIIYMFI